mmetsp:Transcript_45072/g.134543  ORF Transcript_45072/g.134543 Transcript_45072/m.134543 type:complete len:207 (-) Transcript_45072:753-1373(-)
MGRAGKSLPKVWMSHLTTIPYMRLDHHSNTTPHARRSPTASHPQACKALASAAAARSGSAPPASRAQPPCPATMHSARATSHALRLPGGGPRPGCRPRRQASAHDAPLEAARAVLPAFCAVQHLAEVLVHEIARLVEHQRCIGAANLHLHLEVLFDLFGLRLHLRCVLLSRFRRAHRKLYPRLDVLHQLATTRQPFFQALVQVLQL